METTKENLESAKKIEENVEALRKTEEKAISAADRGDWGLASKYYKKLLDLVEGWLERRDPNVLWLKAHLSETFVKLDKDEEAEILQQELLDQVSRPDTDEEKDVLEQVLHLRVEIADKLLNRHHRRKALETLEIALECSVEGLGRKHETTESIRNNRDIINREVLKWEQEKIRKELVRKKGGKELNYGMRDGKAFNTEVLVAARNNTQNEEPRQVGGSSPEVRLTSPANDTFDHEAVGVTRDVVDIAESRIPRARPSSMPDQLPEGGPQNTTPRGRANLATSRHPDASAVESYSTTRRSSHDRVENPMKPSLSPLINVEGHLKTVSDKVSLSSRSRSVDQGTQDTGRNSYLPNSVKPNFSDAALLAGSDDDYTWSDKWFSEWLQKTHELIASNPGTLKSKPGFRPRIAILDTGLNTKHPRLKELLERTGKARCIRGFWSPPEKDWQAKEDEDGHGTQCAMLAHRVAPNADIFIARVFENRGCVEGDHVVEALKYAVDTWKVDIISMSFAISENEHKIKAAMSETFRAIEKRFVVKDGVEIQDSVLFFAAASNSGQNVGRTYPAKRPEVFCIHAAYGNGTSWGGNPDVHLDDWNFLNLGMYTKLEAPQKGQESKRVSGTSIAAPIAAGIAALVLEFCRQTLAPGQEAITRPERLKTKLGMQKIFRQMHNPDSNVPKPKTGKWNYLRPWELLSLKIGHGDSELARRRIATRINAALESLDD